MGRRRGFRNDSSGCPPRRARGRVGIEIAPESQERTSSVSQNQTRCRTRHRIQCGQGRGTPPVGPVLQGGWLRVGAGAERHHRGWRHHRRRRGGRRRRAGPRRLPHQDEGRRRLAFRQRRHRQEDQSAGDDRGRTLRVDTLGSRTVHPVRYPGCEPRLPDPLHPSRRREGQHGSAARRGQEGQDRRLHRRHQQGRPDASRRRTPTRRTTTSSRVRWSRCSTSGRAA
jgi:hypothetical protein